MRRYVRKSDDRVVEAERKGDIVRIFESCNTVEADWFDKYFDPLPDEEADQLVEIDEAGNVYPCPTPDSLPDEEPVEQSKVGTAGKAHSRIDTLASEVLRLANRQVDDRKWLAKLEFQFRRTNELRVTDQQGPYDDRMAIRKIAEANITKIRACSDRIDEADALTKTDRIDKRISALFRDVGKFALRHAELERAIGDSNDEAEGNGGKIEVLTGEMTRHADRQFDYRRHVASEFAAVKKRAESNERVIDELLASDKLKGECVDALMERQNGLENTMESKDGGLERAHCRAGHAHRRVDKLIHGVQDTERRLGAIEKARVSVEDPLAICVEDMRKRLDALEAKPDPEDHETHLKARSESFAKHGGSVFDNLPKASDWALLTAIDMIRAGLVDDEEAAEQVIALLKARVAGIAKAKAAANSAPK